MTISLISDPKLLNEHNDLLYKLRKSGFATKNFGPFTKEHKITFLPETRGSVFVKTINSDLSNFLLSLDIGYMPRLWQEGYTTLGNFGIVMSDEREIERIIDNAKFDSIDNVIYYNPSKMTFDELKTKIQLYFNKLILQKSEICK